MNQSIENEKAFLRQYGKVIDYSQLQENEIREQLIQGLRYRLMYLIKESEVEQFGTYINNIQLEESIDYRTSEVNFKKKHRNYLEIEICVQGNHFVPDNILRNDILFFFKKNNRGNHFIIVKDEYIKQLLESEHCIFGMIDFCGAKDLFLQKDKVLKSKMKIFQMEINKLSIKYKDISFITISDSILIKYAFQIVSKNRKFLPDKFDFHRIIELFKDIRKIIKKIFTMNIYGVFSYGMNKCEAIKSNSSNVFHAGILSHEFGMVLDIEKICRKLKKNKQGDLYMPCNLYRAFRYYVRKNWEYFPIEQSAEEWGVRKEDINLIKETKDIFEKGIIVSKIPDESISYTSDQ